MPVGSLLRCQCPIRWVSNRGVELVHSQSLPEEKVAFGGRRRQPELEFRSLKGVGVIGAGCDVQQLPSATETGEGIPA